VKAVSGFHNFRVADNPPSPLIQHCECHCDVKASNPENLHVRDLLSGDGERKSSGLLVAFLAYDQDRSNIAQ